MVSRAVRAYRWLGEDESLPRWVVYLFFGWALIGTAEWIVSAVRWAL